MGKRRGPLGLKHLCCEYIYTVKIVNIFAIRVWAQLFKGIYDTSSNDTSST